jgi:DNA-binding NarL/FixJ family response regulator
MDLTMPNMDGIAAMNELYLIKPDARVILASGFNEDELSDRITGSPPSGFIRKPYNMALLEAEIRRVLKERH